MSHSIASFPRDRVVEAAVEASEAIVRCPASLRAQALMLAIADVESSGGANCTPRHEPAYDIGGKLYRAQTPGARKLRELRAEWGAWAACSYGAWQVMYPVAIELGFGLTPIDLATKLSVQGAVAATLLTRRVLPQVPPGSDAETALSVIGDAYNSGTSRDAFVPEEYIRKLIAAYAVHAPVQE